MSPIAPTVFDHALFVVLALLLPLFGWLGIRRLRRNIEAGLPYTRRIRDYRNNMLILWGVCAATLGLWSWQARDWSTLGLAAPSVDDGRLIVAALLALSVVAYSYRTLALVRSSSAAAGSVIESTRRFSFALPHSRRDLRWFYALSVTAGITEEVLYRGFMLTYLSGYMPVTAAVVVSSLLFAGGHAYQGARGVVQVFVLAIAFSAMYVLSGSLVVPIFAHVLVDWFGGRAVYVAYKTCGTESAAR